MKTESLGAPSSTSDELRYNDGWVTYLLLAVVSGAVPIAAASFILWGSTAGIIVGVGFLLPWLSVVLAAVLMSILGLTSGPGRFRKRLAVWWGLMITGLLVFNLFLGSSTHDLFIVVWSILLAAIATLWLIGMRLERLRSLAGTSQHQ